MEIIFLKPNTIHVSLQKQMRKATFIFLLACFFLLVFYRKIFVKVLNHNEKQCFTNFYLRDGAFTLSQYFLQR